MADTKVVDLAALSVFKTLQDLANAAVFVCKDGDKVLSTNDFTDEEKARLDEMSTNLSGYHVADDTQVDSMLAEIFGE